MAKLKKSSKSSTDARNRKAAKARRHSRGALDVYPSILAPRRPLKDTFSLVEPQINAEGIHIWPFDVSCPVDVIFMTTHDRQRVRMNRHGYFEVLYLCSGTGVCHIQDRLMPFNEGDVAVIGSTLYHRIECESAAPLTIAALFFAPEFVCCDGANDSAEYLTPFLLQDPAFPHIVPANTGVPRQILDTMIRIQTELPASTPRGRLAVKTYLKLLLMLLVNQYSAYAGTVETFRRQERALDRLRPLFRYLGENCGNTVQVRQAARICGMSESHFMSFFKQVTGLSFVAYLNHFRIERAQTLLAQTDESMVSISQQVGFCDQSYFGTVFRKIVGMTPAAYRRRVSTGRGSAHGQATHIHPLSAGNAAISGQLFRQRLDKEH
jgi:AraC-like DNA-binding protein/mannose-6-phosphate isomerase-like protein (cupin superfamily)